MLKRILFTELVGHWDIATISSPNLVSASNQEVLKQVAVYLLQMIDYKRPYGTELFNALCRLTVTPYIEAVCLRRNAQTSAVEVLLLQRPETEPAYPGQWHCPGTALRPGESEDEAFARLSKGEFWAKIISRRFVSYDSNPHEARGHFLHLIHLCEVEPGAKGTWFAITDLPEKTVNRHRAVIIPRATEVYLEYPA